MERLKEMETTDGSLDEVGEKLPEAENLLFVEESESLRCIDQLSAPLERDAALTRLRAIFDKYLESPTLMDHSLEKMVNNLSQPAQRILHARSRNRRRPDDDGESMVNGDTTFVGLRYHLSALYSLSKVRGRKYVQRFLPYGVSDVEPIWSGLQEAIQMEAANRTAASLATDLPMHSSSSEQEQPPLWESTYMLWIWMTGLSLVPFDCKVVLSDPYLTDNLVETCRASLGDVGPVRPVVAACLASWLSRPDFEEKQQLAAFIQWAQCQVNSYVGGRKKGRDPNIVVDKSVPSEVQILGVLQTMTTILKVSSIDREHLVKQMRPIWDFVMHLADTNEVRSDFLLLKQLVKWWTRMSCAFLPPRSANWRNVQGRRSLFGKLDNSVPGLVQNLDASPSSVSDQKDQDFFLVPDEVEDAVGLILEALAHTSTVIRWSAAKGIGRIAERLPSLCVDDILDHVLLLVSDHEKDQCWHGTCLALAELARRGLLSPKRLPDIVPVVIKAVHYECCRGKTSVGAHVRDAACYTYWAIARAYRPEILRPYIAQLSESIILTSLFDREVNCRRAASAAFQEAVGRQGATSFPHGIEILTTADYFSLGNRSNSYLTIALHIAAFEEHRRCIVQHISSIKLFHWDQTIRTLSSKCMQKLTSLDFTYIVGCVLPTLLSCCLDDKNLSIRHGAVLGVAEVLLATSEMKALGDLTQAIQRSVVELVPAIEKRRLYRGRGGEIMRSAVCRLIECICLAQMPLSVKEQVSFLDCVESCVPHPSETIQTDACRALKALMTFYFPVGVNGPSERLQTRVVDKFCRTALSIENPAVARGYALALGHLPAKLLAPNKAVLTSVLQCLQDLAKHTALVGGESDAATRRNSLSSLTLIAETIGFGRDAQAGYAHAVLDSEHFSKLVSVHLHALEDYRTDQRGDVGSWCRLEGLRGVTALMAAAANCLRAKSFLSSATCKVVVGALLKQLSEKLDAVRQVAGESLQSLLLNQSIDVLVDRSALVEALDLKALAKDWSDPSVTFPVVMKCASIDDSFFTSVVSGMVTSVGGLTENVKKYSTQALLQWAKHGNATQRVKLGSCLLELLDANARCGRVLVPILKTLTVLLSHGSFNDVLPNGDFGSRCNGILQREVQCKDVARMFAVVDVAVALLLSSTANGQMNSRKTIGFLCKLLAHPYPRVRSHVAQQLYVCLLEIYEAADDAHAAALDIVLHTPWKSEQKSDFQSYPAQVADKLNVGPEFASIEC